MKLAFALAVLFAALPAYADPPVIKDTYGFDWLMPQKSKCAKVTGALLTKLTRQYKCVTPEDPTATASGKKQIATCTVIKGKKSEYLLFGSQQDCATEREIQLANGEAG